MPAGDRTGPMGLGPMTGRAAGFCAGYPVPGYMNPMFSRGYAGRGRGFWGRGGGWGRGFGRGFGWVRAGLSYPAWGAAGYPYAPYPVPFAQPPTPEQELAGLKEQSQFLQNALNEISGRIEEMEKAKQEE